MRPSIDALHIGPLCVDPPVVLAPMAGVTNAPFRGVCRRFGAGLYVSRDDHRAGARRGQRARRCDARGFDGPTRRPAACSSTASIPATSARRCAFLVGEGRVDHVDMNFGCPVRKVTRKGGGVGPAGAKPRCCATSCAPPWRAAGAVPVTIKFRIGIDDAHPHLPRHRPHRRGRGLRRGRAARPHRRAALRRRGALGGDRRAQGRGADDPRARQRRHLGGRGRAGDAGHDRLRRRGRRTRLPRPALAVPRPRRCLLGTPGAASATTRRGGLGHAGPRRSAWWSGAARSAA